MGQDDVAVLSMTFHFLPTKGVWLHLVLNRYSITSSCTPSKNLMSTTPFCDLAEHVRGSASQEVSARRNIRPLTKLNFGEVNRNNQIVCGTTYQVWEQLKYHHDRRGIEHVKMYGQESRMSHEAAMANIGLFG